MKFTYPIGATPIDADETDGLIPKHITLQSELNEWEQANIIEAEQWAFGQAHNDILSIPFIKKLHVKMFSDTWKWAGQFRKSLKNIGVDPYEIQQELVKLFEDIDYQINIGHFTFDEIAIHLHHRLVLIHPFPNGNGRHSRILTDIFLTSLQQDKFSWGSGNLNSSNKSRTTYINALRAADQHNYAPLFGFVRS